MLRTVLAILAGPVSGIIALGCFAYGFWMAIFFCTGTGILCLLAVRIYDRHHNPEYDDRLSEARMAMARDWLVEMEVKKRNGKPVNR